VSLLHGGFYDFGVNLHVGRKLPGVRTSPEERIQSNKARTDATRRRRDGS